MFGKPQEEYCKIQIGTEIITAATLTDVPVDTIRRMQIALQLNTDFTCDYLHDYLLDDGDIKIIADDNKTYIIHQKESRLNKIDMGKLDLAKIIAANIKENFDAWVKEWGPVYSNEDEPYQDYANCLRTHLQVLEEIISQKEEEERIRPELGNLLFGNSYGEYRVDRESSQDIFVEWLNQNGFDGYGFYQIQADQNARGGYSNDIFEINPYYWGEDETEADKPNFVFKPTSLEVRWYKYPMRDAYANQDQIDWKMILDACTKSIK